MRSAQCALLNALCSMRSAPPIFGPLLGPWSFLGPIRQEVRSGPPIFGPLLSPWSFFGPNSSGGSLGASTIGSPFRSMVFFWSNSSGGSLRAHSEIPHFSVLAWPDRVKFNELFTVPVRPGAPVPGRSLWHLVTGRTVQNHPDPRSGTPFKIQISTF